MGSNSGTNNITDGLLPFIRVFKDGSVERLRRAHHFPSFSSSVDDQQSGSDDVQFKDVLISPETALSVRIFRPKTTHRNNPPPIIIYFHGRCFFVDTPYSPMYQTFLQTIVTESQSILVSVDFRKAPEHPLPIGYDDCFTTITWVSSRSDEWLQDFQQVFLMGDSAGGNIAHNMAMRVSSENVLTIQGLVLINPFFWGKDPVAGETTKLGERSILDDYWSRACPISKDGSGSGSGLDHPWVNPGADPSLWRLGCERVMVFISQKDVLKYRSWYYFESLRKSGWRGKIQVIETPGENHLFHLEKPDSKSTKNFMKKLVSFINQYY